MSKTAIHKQRERTREYRLIPVTSCDLLRRNPQYLTEKQMTALKTSIQRDGFLVPILVRRARSGRYEVISGNHRFLAAQELGLQEIPAVVVALTKKQTQRIAVNLNTIHGDPEASLLAPYLTEMIDLDGIYLDDSLIQSLVEFDGRLRDSLAIMEIPTELDHDSSQTTIGSCVCPKCGKRHIRKS